MSQFPRVDLHRLAADAGVDLPSAFTQLRALYDSVDAANQETTRGLDLPCHRGCDACCHESVFITPLEFFYVWDHVQREFSDEEREKIVRSALELYAQNHELIEALEEAPPAGETDHFLVAKKLKFRCPLLGEDGTCRVYAVRELYARMFGCSFNPQGGIYGCYLVADHLMGKKVTLLSVGSAARVLDTLPLTHKRQVYPYYLHRLYAEFDGDGRR